MTNTPRDRTIASFPTALPVDDDRTARTLRLLREPHMVEILDAAAALDVAERPLALRLLHLLLASRRAPYS